MTRLLRILTPVLLWLPLAACDYLPSWMPGAKPEKTAPKALEKTPKRGPADEDLPVEQQILQLQQEIQAVEQEKLKLEQRHDEISSEKETISELLREQEADVQRKERELNRLESPIPADR